MRFLFIIFIFISCLEVKKSGLLTKSKCSIKEKICEFLDQDFGKVQFEILKKPFFMNEVIPIQIITEKELSEVMVELEGIEMDMGYNKPLLKGNGYKFKGQLFIPMCTSKKMTYKMSFYLKSQFKVNSYQFILPVTSK